MKILVDADACPVKNIIIKIAKEYGIPVIMLIDTSHVLSDDYAEIITVDKASDSVDIALINKVLKNDIVVSQDFGVAAMAIAKGAKVINQNGMIYTNDNIDGLLFERHIAKKVRRSGGKISGPAKRNKQNDIEFESKFLKLIDAMI